jgi:two-component system cell cycle sensor histidine kinase/response regulator CckA
MTARSPSRSSAESAPAGRETHFRSVAELVPDSIFVLDPDVPGTPLRILYANRAAARAHGYDPGELTGTSLVALIAESDRPLAPDREQRILAGEIVTFEETHRHRDGRLLAIEVRARRIEWEGRRAILGINRDLTDRKKIESDLVESRATYRRLVDSLDAVLWEADPDTFRFTFVSPQAEPLFGFPLAEWTANPTFWRDHLHPDDRDRVVAYYEGECARGRDHEFEYRMATADGRTLWVRDRVQVTTAPDGTRRIFGILEDVTARKRIETDLARSEERLRLALASGRLGTFDWDLATDHVVWSETHYQIFGYAPGDPPEITFRHFTDRVVPEDLAALRANIERARETRDEYRFDYRVRLPDGSIRWVLGVGRFLYDDRGEAVRMLGYVKDVTDRKESELALRKLNDRYALLAGAMQDIVYLMDRDGVGTYVSPSCERLLGYTPAEVIGRKPTPFVHPDEQAAFARAKAENYAGRPTQEEWRYRHKDGRWVWMESLSNPVFDAAGAVTGVVCCVRDITRRKAAEDRARTAQKLEAIGQLAGGIAHDFNNLLTVVNGCAELLLGAVPRGDPRRPLIDDIARAGERGATLTRQLLTFSRQQPSRPVPLDVNETVAGTTRMLTRLLGAHVAIELRLAPGAPAARVDPGQFEQVVVNLAVNARDAMPGGGRLTVATDECDFAGRDDLPPDARPERYVRVAVADTGTGMSPEVLTHLFEPFFTTKPVGRGTGLGLATVHGIVRQAQGFLTVDSDVGAGTTVCVYLPAVPRGEHPAGPAPLPDPDTGGTETVLVVEDDDAVRALTCAVLERKGYDVLPAASAAEALALCDERPAPPDLVVTDLMMPGMTGHELADTLTRRDPDVKLIFLSGYAPESAAFHDLGRDRAAFLQKPFTAHALTRLVRRTLDGLA